MGSGGDAAAHGRQKAQTRLVWAFDRYPERQDTRLRNFPLKGFAANQVWCEIVALACELLAWTQMLALAGDSHRWEPKRLRLRLAQRWPWAGGITAAVARLQALSSG